MQTAPLQSLSVGLQFKDSKYLANPMAAALGRHLADGDVTMVQCAAAIDHASRVIEDALDAVYRVNFGNTPEDQVRAMFADIFVRTDRERAALVEALPPVLRELVAGEEAELQAGLAAADTLPGYQVAMSARVALHVDWFEGIVYWCALAESTLAERV